MIEIDEFQRVTLSPWKQNSKPLKKKVPYEQLQPYFTSELHAHEQPHDGHSVKELLQPSEDIQPLSEDEIGVTQQQPNDHDDFVEEVPPPLKNIQPVNKMEAPPHPCDADSLEELPPMLDDLQPISNNGSETQPEPHDDDPVEIPLPLDNRKSQQPCNDTKRKTILHSSASADPGKLVLSILKDGVWLTDEHVDHVQWLLSEQHSTVNGFHSVLAFEAENAKVAKGQKNFIQLLNMSGDHWVTVTNIGCRENHVKVYDSLYRQPPKCQKSRDKFMACLAALLSTSQAEMLVEWPSLKRQKGCSDCGLFALAVAVSLCNGDDPSMQDYDQTVMREHLALCVDCRQMSVFPTKSASRNIGKSRQVIEPVFCNCRMPYAEGTFMIQCMKCQEWFHQKCENVPKSVSAETVFHCKACK